MDVFRCVPVISRIVWSNPKLSTNIMRSGTLTRQLVKNGVTHIANMERRKTAQYTAVAEYLWRKSKVWIVRSTVFAQSGAALQKNKSNTFTTTIGVNTACFSRSIIPPFRRLTATQFLAIGRRASFHTIALLLHRH